MALPLASRSCCLRVKLRRLFGFHNRPVKSLHNAHADTGQPCKRIKHRNYHDTTTYMMGVLRKLLEDYEDDGTPKPVPKPKPAILFLYAAIHWGRICEFFTSSRKPFNGYGGTANSPAVLGMTTT